MRRVLAGAAIALAAFAFPASASDPVGVGGHCEKDGTIRVLCRTDVCQDYCTPTFCLVWGGYGCKL